MWRTKWVPKHFGDTDAPPLWDWGGVDPLETSFDASVLPLCNRTKFCRFMSNRPGVRMGSQKFGDWCPVSLGTGGVTVLLEHSPALNILLYQISSL